MEKMSTVNPIGAPQNKSAYSICRNHLWSEQYYINIDVSQLHCVARTFIQQYLHFHCESLNEPLHLRCGSYLHDQIDLSHTYIRAI